MAYLGPKGSVPTHRGWVHPKTGELLKRQKLTSDFIAEWNAGATPTPEPVIQTLHEAPVVESSLSSEVIDFHYGDEEEE